MRAEPRSEGLARFWVYVCASGAGLFGLKLVYEVANGQPFFLTLVTFGVFAFLSWVAYMANKPE